MARCASPEANDRGQLGGSAGKSEEPSDGAGGVTAQGGETAGTDTGSGGSDGGFMGMGGAPASAGGQGEGATGGGVPGGTGGNGGGAAAGPGGNSGGTSPPILPPSGDAKFTCTQILGAPQTVDWFDNGLFDKWVGAGLWQRVGNTGVNHYTNTGDAVWSEKPSHPCSRNSDKPDRVLLVGWGHNSYSAGDWASRLREGVATIRQKIPSCREIYLMPAIGRVGCGGYASQNFENLSRGIEQVVAGDVRAAPLLQAAACNLIAGQQSDMLAPEAWKDASNALGEFFMTRR